MTTRRTDRRSDALSRARILETAIALLDGGGEAALTFRALAARLATGAGAIYWHVADKDALLSAATDQILAAAVAGLDGEAAPAEVIRAVTLAVFDAIDAHPWVGAQLSRMPWQPAMLQVYERIGRSLQALGAPEAALFDAWSALVNYTLGVAVQNAANARVFPPGVDRAAVLAAAADRWAQAADGPDAFAHRIRARLGEHDDREQFLAGVDLILAGIRSLR